MASWPLQVKAAGEKMESDLHEMSKPLTRGVDDEDRENHLKDVEHADDPMLQYMRKKRSKADGKTQMEPNDNFHISLHRQDEKNAPVPGTNAGAQ